jgi:DNA polymerase I-like protein with 3'-5' exonuclease and polymerase domains
VVLDFETTNLEKGDAGVEGNKLILACWLDGSDLEARRVDRIQHDRADEFNQRRLTERIESADFIVCHNAKFELKWLHRMGVDLRRVCCYDTQIGEYCLAGNRKRELSLDGTAKRYGLFGKSQWVSVLIKSGYPVEDIGEEYLREYCEQDVRLTHEIFRQQRKALHESKLLRVFYSRCLATPALADIEYKGTRLDADKVRDAFRDYSERYERSLAEFERVTGGINFKSSKQVRAYLYDKLGFEEALDYKGNPLRTKGGQKATKKEIVATLEAKTPEQEEFKGVLLPLLHLKKKMQILEQMMGCCKEDNGHIYASLNQTVTGTHRLSSTGGKWGFQFHNFPREFKPLFRARKDGWLMVEADAPSLEFRVAVDMGGDRQGKEDIRQGVDVHRLSADTIKVSRQDAKKYTFRPLYGGDSGTTLERRYYKAFRQKYSGIYETQTRWTYEVLSSKKLTIPSGLTFYWPDTEISRSGYIKNRTNIFNYPIQSFATADIIPLTLVLVWHYCKDISAQVTNTIHDSIIADVHPDSVDRFRQILIRAFSEDIYKVLKQIYDYDFTTPLGVGIKIAEHWGDTKQEEKYEAKLQ